MLLTHCLLCHCLQHRNLQSLRSLFLQPRNGLQFLMSFGTCPIVRMMVTMILSIVPQLSIALTLNQLLQKVIQLAALYSTLLICSHLTVISV